MTNFSFVDIFRLFKKIINSVFFVFLLISGVAQVSFAKCDTESAKSTMKSNFTSGIYLYPNVIPYIENCLKEFGTEYKNAEKSLNIKKSMNLDSTESIVDALSQGQYTDGSTDLPPLQRAISFAKIVDTYCKKDKNVSSSGAFSGAGKGRTSDFVKLCADITKLASTDMKGVAASGTKVPNACSGAEPVEKITGCFDGKDELDCGFALISPETNSKCKEHIEKDLGKTPLIPIAKACAQDATLTNPKCQELCDRASEVKLCTGYTKNGDNKEGGDSSGAGSEDGDGDGDISTASTDDSNEVTQDDVGRLAGMASQFQPGQTQYGLKAQDDGSKYQATPDQAEGGDPRFQGGISGSASSSIPAISQIPRTNGLWPSGGSSASQKGGGQGSGGATPAVGSPQNNQASRNNGGGNKSRGGGRRRNRLTDVLDGLKGNRFMGTAISEPGGDGALDPKYKNKIAENKKDEKKKPTDLDPLRAAYRKALNRNTAGEGDGFLPALYFPMIDENFSEIKERQSYTIEKGQSF